MVIKLDTTIALLSVLSSISSAFPAATSKLHTRAEFEWTALGDSYASGVGAGEPDELKRCFRYSEAYPRALQANTGWPPGDGGNKKFNNVVCSGASTQDILDHQFREDDSEDAQYGKRPKFGSPKVATLTLGGNDIGLRYLLNSCVYNFYPTYLSCKGAIEDALTLLQDDQITLRVSRVIEKTLEMGKAASGNDFKVFVTGYAKFFNANTDYCDKVSWSSRWVGEGEKVDKKMRTTFNEMADLLNQKIKAAVKMNPGALFVDIDTPEIMDGHRYCEEGVEEPDRDNPDGYFWQAFDESDSVEDIKEFDDATARILDPSVSGFDELVAKYRRHESSPGLEPHADYVGAMFQAVLQEPDPVKGEGWLAWLIQRVRSFHPKKPLHDIYARRIAEEYNKVFLTAAVPEEPPNEPEEPPNDLTPLGDLAAQCHGDEHIHLPNDWILSDGRHTMATIFARMRDQACQGICESIEGVPAELMSAVKDITVFGEGKSCELAVKITKDLEMFMRVTHHGQNCIEATSRIETTCQKGRSGWINGPNNAVGESYSLGVRPRLDLNAHHKPWENDHHLPYNQLRCRFEETSFRLIFYVDTVNFDDGRGGESIRERLRKHCGGIEVGSVWVWRQAGERPNLESPTPGYDFGGGQISDHFGEFNSLYGQVSCTADNMCVALGIPKGSIECIEM